MGYFLGGISILILIMALPSKTLLAIAVYLLASAVIVKIVASLVTQTDMYFSKSIKAVAYSLFFTVIALGIIIAFAPSVFLFAPVLIFFAHALAYSIALEVPLFGSAAIALCVMGIGWLIMLIFGISTTALMA